MMNNFVASIFRDWIILFILKGNGIAFRGCKSTEHVVTIRSCPYLQCTTRGLWAWRSFSWRWSCTSDKNVKRSDGEWGTPLKKKKIKPFLSINQTMTWFVSNSDGHRMEERVSSSWPFSSNRIPESFIATDIVWNVGLSLRQNNISARTALRIKTTRLTDQASQQTASVTQREFRHSNKKNKT